MGKKPEDAAAVRASGTVSFFDLLLGFEGLACLRTWPSPDPSASRRRLEEVRSLCDRATDYPSFEVDEVAVETVYAAWATAYDTFANPLIAIEEPVVRGIIDRHVPGRAVDVACGTGRHTKYLVTRGHQVVGVDASEEMLLVAATNCPGAQFAKAEMRAIPVRDGASDLTVCALAISHLDALEPATRELARITRPGGHVIVSDIYPIVALLGGHVMLPADAGGRRLLVRTAFHPHGDYLAAFGAAGLSVRGCHEPRYTDEIIALNRIEEIAETQREGMLDFPAALIWDLERAA